MSISNLIFLFSHTLSLQNIQPWAYFTFGAQKILISSLHVSAPFSFENNIGVKKETLQMSCSRGRNHIILPLVSPAKSLVKIITTTFIESLLLLGTRPQALHLFISFYPYNLLKEVFSVVIRATLQTF